MTTQVIPISVIVQVLSALAEDFKAQAGSAVCVHVSTMVMRVLERFGYSSRMLAVNALVCDVRNEALLGRPTAGSHGHPEQLRRPFPVFALGAYDDAVAPVTGGSRLPNMSTAAHVVVLVEQPRVIIDLTIDQLNRLGANVSRFIHAAAPRQFPDKEALLRLRESGLYLQYNWVEADQEAIPQLDHPTPDQVDRLEHEARVALAERATAAPARKRREVS